MHKTSIAIITSHAPSLINFRYNLIVSLIGKGFTVLAIAPNFNEETRAAVIEMGALPIDSPMSRTGMNPIIDIVNTWRLIKILREFKPFITLGYFIKPVIFGSIAAWAARVPNRFAMIEGLGFVFTPTEVKLNLKRRVLKKIVLYLYKVGLSCADRVIFLNPDDRDELVAENIIPFNKAFLLGGIGVDLAKWPSMEVIAQPITFLCVARLLREKGVVQYAQAAKIVKKIYPDIRFILLGGLDENPGSITVSEVDQWVNDGTLEWYGHVSVLPWMMQASVFVLPSYREGVPASTQEAMAVGRAIITTDVPGCRQTVIDGFNGYLIPPRNSDALASAMFRFIEQPDLIVTMGKNSRHMAEEIFDVHKVNQRLISVLVGDGVRNEASH